MRAGGAGLATPLGVWPERLSVTGYRILSASVAGYEILSP